MGIKKYKPTTPGRRGMTSSDFAEITKSKPEKSLIEIKSKINGRNNDGNITVRHRGGGHKRFYRIIDFKRNKIGIPAKVTAIEYDPNRSARIALVVYADGEKRYIIAPLKLKVGDIIENGPDVEVRVGNAMPIRKIPVGTIIHNIEMKPGKGAQIARGAGTSAQIVGKEEKYAQIKLPSSELRMILVTCYATIGQVGNTDHENQNIGKAGRKRWMGIRPTVRGVAMNPFDHPHGGGEGRSPQGNPHPVSPWGMPTKGKKTRNKKKPSNKFIIKKRK